MSHRLSLTLISALLAAGLPTAVVAQQEPAGSPAMWETSVKRDAKDVATFGEGFVVVGGNERKPDGKAWTSADGTTWRKVDDESFDGAVLRRATAFGDGVVALGTKGRKLLGWHSADGTTWQRTTIDRVDKGVELFPDAVVDGPAGLIAVASMVTQDLVGQRFYASTDGTSWQEIEPPSDTANGIFVSLGSTPDEYIAVARPLYGPGSDLYWRSTDGVTWEPFEGPAEGYLIDLVVGDDGTIVGVGQHAETLVPQIWRADELGEWETVYEAPSDKVTEERLEIVAVGGPGFIAGGSTSACPAQEPRFCPTASVLVSEDGREWRALGIDDGVPGPLHDTLPSAVAANADTSVVLAWHLDRPMEVWTLASGQ